MRRSEELYRSIVRNFPGAAIYVLDRDMRLMAVEGAVFGRISMGREQMEGKPLREVLDEDLCRIIEPRYRLVLEGRTCSYETVYLGRVFLSSYVPLRDPQGQVAGGLVVAIDITERKSMEEELRKARDELELRVKQRTAELLERNEQLALAQRAARAGFWILDQNSGRVYSSEGWKGIMGISADQEHCESDLKRLVHPGDWTRLYNAYRFAVRETGRLAVEFRINHPERGERWVLCRGKCMGSEGDGHGSRMVGMILDITERKHIEMQLKRMARRSAKEHNRRKELSKRMIDLLEADRRQIAMYLHDHIGQMLTTMKMDLERVESRLSDIRLLNDIDAAKEKAMEMMAGIRGIIQDLRPSTLDNLGLVPSIRTLMEKTEQTAESLHIHLYTRDIPQDLDLKKQLAIFRIVQEALTNILKHAQAGDVFINLVRRGKTLSLSIEDDGKGFDSEAFFTKRAGISSWGLLFMQERAVQAGGRFEVESHPHKGTFICVEIPV